MHIVVAPDKFKNSLDSAGVCAAIVLGLKEALPGSTITCLPLSDGGDGLAAVLQHYSQLQKREAVVADPLGRSITAHYLYDPDTKLALVEMAQASGIQLLRPEEYDPLRTSTLGTGQLILAAMQQGARRMIIGIGGSATNDGGMGMAVALGYRFLNASGEVLPPCGASLSQVVHIDVGNVVDLRHIQFEVASDVTNPLTGPQGAAYVFASQKGADVHMVQQLEKGMIHYAGVVAKQLGKDLNAIVGGGAAGGMGAGCVAFLNASISSGAQLALAYSNAEHHISHADLVITGEGKLDATTWNGKLVSAVAALCCKHQKPLVALCGTLDTPPATLRTQGVAAAFSIVSKPMSLEEAMAQTPVLLQHAASALGGLIQALIRQHDAAGFHPNKP